jgi:[ribosomal protein S5]-alanine N-acetyltransferase
MPDMMPDRLALPPIPALPGESVLLRGRRESDIDDRVREPIDPEEEDAYGSTWRRDWDGRRYHARDDLAARFLTTEPGGYNWAVEYEGHCIGGAGLRVNPDQHRAAFWIGLFVADLRGRGLGRQITRLILDWAFSDLGLHRVELEVLATNHRAIRCYLACGFRQEGVRREAELYPDGWQDFVEMAVLDSEYAPAP